MVEKDVPANWNGVKSLLCVARDVLKRGLEFLLILGHLLFGTRVGSAEPVDGREKGGCNGYEGEETHCESDETDKMENSARAEGKVKLSDRLLTASLSL